MSSEELVTVFLSLGALFLLGLLADLLGRRTPLPRVTLLIVAGLLIGPSGLDLLPVVVQEWFAPIGAIALTMVGFLLGGHLTRARLARNGRYVLYFSATVVLGAVTVMALGLAAIGVPVATALLFAGMSTATAPAAVADVVDESEASGPFTDTLLGTVAVDDAWGLVVFSMLLASAGALAVGSTGDVLIVGVQELLGAVLLGVAAGLPMAMLTGRMRPGRPALVEGLGFLFLGLGLALWLEVSFLLTGIVMGTVVANLAKHHERPFHEIEGVEGPFMILFFLLAGASLHLESLVAVGVLGPAYILLRTVGRLVSSRLAARMSGAPAGWGRWMGPALLPQAGVAIGMALVVLDRFPELGDTILPVMIGSTVVFELVGPVLTRLALVRLGEA
jgi:Kef-type K+ transport system membrane component KefB